MKSKIIAMIATIMLASVLNFGCVEQTQVYRPSIVTAPTCLKITKDGTYLKLDSVAIWSKDQVEDALLFIRDNGIKKITLSMCNPGGEIFAMWAIYDLLSQAKAMGLQIDSHATGLIASAAVPIYLLGDKRTATKHCYVMIHPHSGVASESNPPSVNEMFLAWTKEYARILDERTDISYDQAMALMTGTPYDTTYMDAKTALKLGIFTEVLE